MTRTLDVRAISQRIAILALLVTLSLVAADPGWHHVWLLPGGLCIVLFSHLPERLSPLVRLLPVLVGHTVLALGMSADQELQNVYVLLMYVLNLLGAGSLAGLETAIAGTWMAGWYVLARYLVTVSLGHRYDLGTAMIDVVTCLSVSFLVYGSAEGQRKIKHLNQMLAERSHQTETELQRTLETSRDIVLVSDFTRKVLSISPACWRILGYTPAELVGRTLGDTVHPDDREACAHQWASLIADGGFARFEYRYLHKDGAAVWLEWDARCDQENGVIRSVARDITERKRFEAELSHLATHDGLTGLLNRRGFEEALTSAIRQSAGALLYLDLDEFKYINDSQGHRAGDGLLRNLAAALSAHGRQGDVLSRVGGDEFAMLLPKADLGEARAVAESILEVLRQQPLDAGGQPVSITASIGVALFPAHGETLEALLVHADQAMYQAKAHGRNVVAIYQPDADFSAQVQRRLTSERLIRQALEQNGFVLYAQPILDLATGHIPHYELLLRMLDAGGDLLPPAAFLDVAERFGLIHQIDRWVVRQAIGLMARLEQEGQQICLEVNLSARALTDAELLVLLRRELAATGIDPHRLVFEITETAAIADIDAAMAFVHEMKALGCRFALDDFGAGFSSFDRLKRLPVDYLKLDGSFIRNLPSDEEDRHLVKAMVDVARGLGKRTIAEFVENGETLEKLQESGVDYAQGYHVGRPRPISEIWPQVGEIKATAG
jgi:diguanylate cyclase (GGDEF)-like protein/PAS domain S-box-containing protein